MTTDRMTAGALLFDMDGVLVDSGAASIRVLQRWGARHGVDPAVIAAIPHGRKTRDTVAGIAPHLELEQEVAWVDAEEMTEFDGITGIRGAAALVRTLPADRWAVVTSCGYELALLRLAAAGISAPPAMISGDRVKEGKPSPEGYLRGAERLGYAPGDCVVVEDALAGVEAGRAAGMRVIGVTTHYSSEELAGCDWIVRDLSGFSAALRDGALELTLHSGRGRANITA